MRLNNNKAITFLENLNMPSLTFISPSLARSKINAARQEQHHPERQTYLNSISCLSAYLHTPRTVQCAYQALSWQGSRMVQWESGFATRYAARQALRSCNHGWTGKAWLLTRLRGFLPDPERAYAQITTKDLESLNVAPVHTFHPNA